MTHNVHQNIQVAVKTPRFIPNATAEIFVDIQAFYTFGKPVNGTATVKATPILSSKNAWYEISQPLSVTQKIRGINAILIKPSEFRLPVNRTMTSILIETEVQETVSGLVARGFDKTVVVDASSIPSLYYITMTYFGFLLPNSQHAVTVQVRAKSGSPLPTDQQVVHFQSAFGSADYDNSTRQEFELDANGKVNVSITIPAIVPTRLRFRAFHGLLWEEATIEAKPLHVQMINTTTK
jgi:Macroglobulin domain MG3